MISALTEAYFLTNNDEAWAYLYGTRKDDEAQAIFDGIGTYFLNKSSKKGH